LTDSNTIGSTILAQVIILTELIVRIDHRLAGSRGDTRVDALDCLDVATDLVGQETTMMEGLT